MALTGAQWKLLNDALVKAFPGLPQLTMMLQFQCNVALAQIAAPGPLNRVVFQVIQTAEAEGWTGGLVAGARASNPRNADLAAAAPAGRVPGGGPPGPQLPGLITPG